MSPYDAILMAGEMRMTIGEKHYQEIKEAVEQLENARKEIDWDAISDFETDFDPNPYSGSYGNTDED